MAMGPKACQCLRRRSNSRSLRAPRANTRNSSSLGLTSVLLGVSRHRAAAVARAAMKATGPASAQAGPSKTRPTDCTMAKSRNSASSVSETSLIKRAWYRRPSHFSSGQAAAAAPAMPRSKSA